MAKRDLIKTTNKVAGTINEYYDITTAEFRQLKEIADTDIYSALELAFKYGYAMGGRAAKAGKYEEVK